MLRTEQPSNRNDRTERKSGSARSTRGLKEFFGAVKYRSPGEARTELRPFSPSGRDEVLFLSIDSLYYEIVTKTGSNVGTLPSFGYVSLSALVSVRWGDRFQHAPVSLSVDTSPVPEFVPGTPTIAALPSIATVSPTGSPGREVLSVAACVDDPFDRPSTCATLRRSRRRDPSLERHQPRWCR